MKYHCYADDTQLYIVVEPLCNWGDISNKLTVCLSDIRDWMSSNLLKLNQDKTELMVFAPKNKVGDLQQFALSFGDATIHDSENIKNLGISLIKP